MFHEILLLPYFFPKFGKMSLKLPSGAVVIGALRVDTIASSGDDNKYKHIAQFK